MTYTERHFISKTVQSMHILSCSVRSSCA